MYMYNNMYECIYVWWCLYCIHDNGLLYSHSLSNDDVTPNSAWVRVNSSWKMGKGMSQYTCMYVVYYTVVLTVHSLYQELVTSKSVWNVLMCSLRFYN